MDKEKEIDRLKKELEKEREETEFLREVLRSYERGIIWKIWHVIDSTVDFFLPKNTFRRSIYDETMEKMHELINGELNVIKKIFGKRNVSKIKKPSRLSTTEPIEAFSASFPKYENPSVSIIVLTFNNVRFTHQCLDSILKHTDVPYELIIVDNNSTDETKDLLLRVEGTIKIFNEKNIGFGNACNIGAKIAKANFLLFLNNDTIVTPKWLPPLLETMNSIKNCGAVGGKIIGFNGLLQEAGGIISEYGYCKVRGRGKDPNLYEYSYGREVDHCTAACLLVRKNVFLEIGGFDTQYGLGYYEDVDLSMAIKTLGYKIYYQPQSIVYHNQHTSASKKRITYLMIRNMIRFKRKWDKILKKIEHTY